MTRDDSKTYAELLAREGIQTNETRTQLRQVENKKSEIKRCHQLHLSLQKSRIVDIQLIVLILIFLELHIRCLCSNDAVNHKTLRICCRPITQPLRVMAADRTVTRPCGCIRFRSGFGRRRKPL